MPFMTVDQIFHRRDDGIVCIPTLVEDKIDFVEPFLPVVWFLPFLLLVASKLFVFMVMKHSHLVQSRPRVSINLGSIPVPFSVSLTWPLCLRRGQPH